MNDIKNDIVKLFEKITGKMTEIQTIEAKNHVVRYLNELFIETKATDILIINSHRQDEENKGKSMRFKINLNNIKSIEFGSACFQLNYISGKKMIISVYKMENRDLKVLLQEEVIA